MPLSHLRTFRVRYYECDADGWVHHANYLRYMQETAFDASAAAGYDLARYAALGCHWLIRETDLEVLRPLGYGAVVQVKTWVADFRRVRSWRAYEFRLAGSGELVARAGTDWAFLDSRSGWPAPIPPEIKAAFFPEGAPESPLPRERFPWTEPPPDGVFCRRRRIEWADLDPVGHVNNATYLAYAEDLRRQAMATPGWLPERRTAEGRSPVARRHRIEYRQPAVPGDELELSIWLVEEGTPSAALASYCALTRVADGALVARLRTAWG